MQPEITGYKVTVVMEAIDGMFYASAPGVGSIYIEEASLDKALELVQEAVTSILEAREELDERITESNEFIEVLREPFDKLTPKAKTSTLPMEGRFQIPVFV